MIAIVAAFLVGKWGHYPPAVALRHRASPPYDHCNFTALPDFDRELGARWQAALLRMTADEPRWRRIMDLESLNRWLPGRKEGYADVLAAPASDFS